MIGEVQNDEVTATYLYGTNLLSTNNGTSTNYYLFNAHGDVTGITDSAQTVTKTYDYDACTRCDYETSDLIATEYIVCCS